MECVFDQFALSDFMYKICYVFMFLGAIKTDKSKRRIVGFGGKVLTDKKSGRFVLGPFLIQPIILFLFILVFLLLEWIWLENSVGGSWAGQICPFLAKNSV